MYVLFDSLESEPMLLDIVPLLLLISISTLISSSHPIRYEGDTLSTFAKTETFDNGMSLTPCSILLIVDLVVYPVIFANSSCVRFNSTLRFLILSPIFMTNPLSQYSNLSILPILSDVLLLLFFISISTLISSSQPIRYEGDTLSASAKLAILSRLMLAI